MSARRWNFNRYRNGRLMAEGIAVHAIDSAEATRKAALMNSHESEGHPERLEFRDNRPCASSCNICQAFLKAAGDGV